MPPPFFLVRTSAINLYDCGFISDVYSVNEKIPFIRKTLVLQIDIVTTLTIIIIIFPYLFILIAEGDHSSHKIFKVFDVLEER